VSVSHSGATKKYSANWAQVFGAKKTAVSASKAAAKGKPSAGSKPRAAKKAKAGAVVPAKKR
jgi:hypothetical protein